MSARAPHGPAVLVVSNGRGEDAVGAAVGRLLQRAARVTAFPLVGTGGAYAGLAMLDPRADLPSGGFALRGGIGMLLRDLRAGGIGLWRRQRQTLAGRAGIDQVALAVGDVYALWMAARTRAPIVFVATAKSESMEPHRGREVAIMRAARAVFTRDAATAEVLRARGVAAHFAGNPLVDVIPEPAGPLPLPPGAPVVLLLPGSRADAGQNVRLLLAVARRLTAVEPAIFVAALAPSVETVRVVRDAAAAGWAVDGSFLRIPTAAVYVTRDFGAAVRRATVAVGLAGTANEQAAALGVPVVAFAAPGAVQYTSRFMRLQHRLLGDALLPAATWDEASRLAAGLLRDPEERARRGAVGRARMGPAGAVPIIAAEVRGQLRGP